MAIVVQWYDQADQLLDSGTISLSGTPGQRSSSVVVKLWNNRGGVGADPIENAFVRLQARLVGDPYWLASGLPALDQSWVQAKISAGINWTTPATDWFPLGPGLYFPIPDLSNNRGLELELSIDEPISGVPTVLEVAFEVVSSTGQPIGEGLTESTPDGVFLGLRDGRSTYLFRAANSSETAGTPDNNVQVGGCAGVARGLPFVIRPQSVASALAAAGLARYDLFAVDVDGTLAVVAGTEAATPVKPTAAEDQQPLFYLFRNSTDPVEDNDIEEVWALGALGATYSGASPVLTVGSGKARVDNWLTRDSGQRSITLTLSATNWVWLLRSGALAKTTGAAPTRPSSQPRAYLLGKAIVDGTGITSWIDMRSFVGHELVRVVFDFGHGEVVEDEWRYAHVPSRRNVLIPPTQAVHLMLGEQAVTPTSGATTLRVQARVAGTWTDLVTDAGDYASVAYDAANTALRAAADADLLELAGDLELRARVEDVPAGSALDPTGVVGVLEVSP